MRSRIPVLLALFGAPAVMALNWSALATQPSQSQATAPVAPPQTAAESPADYPGLHNVLTYHEGFVCGAAPEGDQGFDTLKSMGIKTIISVDGAEPEVAAAKARGIRYVHLPIGYNGFDDARKLELTRAVRDLSAQGPVYIHCHHGKHRAAGAAAAIAVSLGWMDTSQATKLMKVSGTAPNYTGLYKCAADAAPLTAAQIDAAPAFFPEVSRPNTFVKSMIDIDETNDRLRLIERAGWKAPQDHPDLVPAAEAGRLADLFRILSDGDRAKSKPADFADLMRTNGQHAQAIEDLLLKDKPDPKALSAQLSLVATSCKDCHAKYRD